MDNIMEGRWFYEFSVVTLSVMEAIKTKGYGSVKIFTLQ